MMDNTIPLTELFDSVGKIRIINTLAINGELNITAITEQTGLNSCSSFTAS